MKDTAILEAVKLTGELGLQNAWIESDCLHVVKSIYAQGEDFSSIGHVIQLIKEAINNPIILGINHVSRRTNVPADGW